MRYAFLLTVIALLELLSLGAALSLTWVIQLWVATELMQTTEKIVWAVVFIITNALLVLSLTKRLPHSYRWVSGWLLVMYFMVLSSALSLGLGTGYELMIAVLLDRVVSTAIGARVLAAVFFVGLLLYALYSAYVPAVRRLTLNIDKPLASPLRIAVASDLHLGALFGVRAIDRLQRLLKKNNADVLLMPGDIMDDNIKAFSAHNMSHNLAALVKSVPYGVYATLGNHDLYGHEQPISDTLRAAGVTLLTDAALCLDYANQPVWLVGRFDNHKRLRAPTADLLAKVDTSRPVILLDHRPSDIEQHSQLPIDVQVSGHTHNGQIFPINFIVKALNRLGYGYEAINGRHFVVSSGYGFWGIPFRLGSRSEIWLITLIGN